jgi:putative peptidoglycan lipid II flippase
MAIASVISCAAGLLLRTPIIAMLFQRGSFTAESTQLVSNVFVGLAPSLIGWTLMDLISRCCFALDRPRLPLIAAFVPVTVNCIFLEILNLRHALTNPVLLGLGASTGLIAGFIVIFLMTKSLSVQAKAARS